MDRFSIVAFNEYVESAGSAVVVHSSNNDVSKLAIFDQIGFTATVEQVAGSNPQIEIAIAHSADGQHFTDKDVFGPVDIMSGMPNHIPGFSDGTKPTLQYVRFRIKVTVDDAGPIHVRVRIDATVNDTKESAFAAKWRAAMRRGEELNGCMFMVQGGTPMHYWPDALIKAFYRLYNADTEDLLANSALAEKGLSKYDIAQFRKAAGEANRTLNTYFVDWESAPADELDAQGDFHRRVPTLASAASACIRADGGVVLSMTGKTPKLISAAENTPKGGAGPEGSSCP